MAEAAEAFVLTAHRARGAATNCCRRPVVPPGTMVTVAVVLAFSVKLQG